MNILTNTPPMETNEQIVEATMNGSAHFAAWSAVCQVLDECVPDWGKDSSKTPVEQAVAAIRRLAANQETW